MTRKRRTQLSAMRVRRLMRLMRLLRKHGLQPAKAELRPFRDQYNLVADVSDSMDVLADTLTGKQGTLHDKPHGTPQRISGGNSGDG